MLQQSFPFFVTFAIKSFHMKVRYAILFCCTAITMISCNNAKKNHIQRLEDVSEKAETQTAKISEDSTYSTSDDFYSGIQNMSEELEKQTYGMSENDKRLVYFETSMRMLEKYALRLKEKPSLSKNKDYIRIIQAWASKVRDYNLTLTKEKLNPEQTKKFESIKAQFARI